MIRRVLAVVLLPWAQAFCFTVTLTFAADDQIDEAGGELRKQLTERIDQRRPLQPTTFEVRGRLLTVSGSYEINPHNLRPANSRAELGRRDRLLLDHGAEAEAFYPLDSQWSLFAQLHLTQEKDLHAGRFERIAATSRRNNSAFAA